MTRTRMLRTVGSATSILAGMAVPPTTPAIAAQTTAVRPAVVGVSPAAGRTTGGNTVAIEGRGMFAATAVYFASTHATHLVHVSSTRVTVRVPRRTHGTVHVRVMGPGGRSAPINGDRYRYVVHAPALRWSRLQSIDPDAGQLSSVSCPTPSFCAAVGSNAAVHVYRNGTWSQVTLPATVPSRPDLAESMTPQAVSCTSASFCVVARQNTGPVYTYNGTSWSAGPQIGLISVSCVSPTFCMGLGDRHRRNYIFDGTRWTRTAFAGLYALPALSCSSPTRCVAATDLAGTATTYDAITLRTFDGTSWDHHLWRNSHSAAVSCPRGAPFCIVVNRFGHAVRYSGRLHPVAADSSNAAVTGLSCADATSCVAILDDGTTERYDVAADSWSTPIAYDPHQGTPSTDNVGGVSCATRTACTAVDQDGYAYRGADAAWTGTLVEPHTGNLDDISCASDAACTAVDATGNALSYNGRTWTRPVNLANLDSLSHVSCPTAVFCVAIGAPVQSTDAAHHRDDAVLKINGHWQQTSTAISVGDQVYALSCSSADLCVATTAGGRAIEYHANTWSAPQQVDAPGRALTAVSCPSDGFCLAGDDLGHEIRYNGSAWSAPAGTGAHGHGFFSISCANKYYCVSGSDLVRVRRNGVWGDTGVPGFGDGQYSCPTTTFCLDLAGSFDAPRNYTFDGAAKVNGGIRLANPTVECASASLCFSAEGDYVETGRAG